MSRAPTIAAVVALAAIAALLGACSTTRRSPRSDAQRATEIARVLLEHNERAERMTSLWARVSVRVKGTDAQGDPFEEQGEGHLQIIPPASVSLTVGKLGETYFTYGSSPTSYWMFDLSDSDNRTALVGDIALITRPKAEAIGLGVHPGDLVALIGVQRIDPSEITETRWLDDDEFALTVPSRWGETEFAFDLTRRMVSQVRLLDASGAEIARSRLGQYKQILDPVGLETGDLVTGIVEVVTPGDDGFLRLGISEPTMKDIRPAVYDFGRLRRAYRAREVIDLDHDVDWGTAQSTDRIGSD